MSNVGGKIVALLGLSGILLGGCAGTGGSSPNLSLKSSAHRTREKAFLETKQRGSD